jgi:hypothetical protein
MGGQPQQGRLILFNPGGPARPRLQQSPIAVKVAVRLLRRSAIGCILNDELMTGRRS